MFVLDLCVSNLWVHAEQNAFHLYKPQAVAARGKKNPKLCHLVTTEQDIVFTHDMISGTWQMLCATALCVCKQNLYLFRNIQYANMLIICLCIIVGMFVKWTHKWQQRRRKWRVLLIKSGHYCVCVCCGGSCVDGYYDRVGTAVMTLSGGGTITNAWHINNAAISHSVLFSL